MYLVKDYRELIYDDLHYSIDRSYSMKVLAILNYDDDDQLYVRFHTNKRNRHVQDYQ